MQKQIKVDMSDMVEIMESFVKKLSMLEEADKIDLAARLKPVAKACKTIDDHVKDMIKTKLKHKEGSRQGELFKAVLKLVKTTRFNQKDFKEDQPDLFEQYNEECTDERVTFELR